MGSEWNQCASMGRRVTKEMTRITPPLAPLKGGILLLKVKWRYLIPITLSCLLHFSNEISAQQYDLLIKNGHVIDPKNHINGKKDIAIAGGKIVKVDDNIPS